MTRRKPRISYRELLAEQPGGAPVSESVDAPVNETASAVPAEPVMGEAASSSVASVAVPPTEPLPPPRVPEARDSAMAPPPAVVTRSSTPIALASVLNASARRTPGATAVIAPPPLPAERPAAARPPAGVAGAPRPVPGTARRLARATVAGRISIDSAIRTDLAMAGRAELLRFRIGPERFALRLADVDEAIEAPVLHPLPDLPRHVLGVCAVRGRLVPVHAPEHVLGVQIGSLGVALVLTGDPPLALAVDDVEDVFVIQPRELHEAPGVDDLDGVLVGVARFAGKLVGVLDAPALAIACLAPVSPEP